MRPHPSTSTLFSAAIVWTLAAWGGAGCSSTALTAQRDRLPPAHQQPEHFRDCADCPEMVVIPAGAFVIGSPDDEPGRGPDEGPQKKVTIDHPFAMARFEVTRGDYERFLADTGHAISGNCMTDRASRGTWAFEPHTTLRDPGFVLPQDDRHPVACVSWHDAQAYIEWLNHRTGGGYRLPTESEWEYAARAGATTRFPWGDDVEQGCSYANLGDANMTARYTGYAYAKCNDGYLNTSPVGTYRPNAFGVYDLLGNMGEWTTDCSTKSYAALPADGTANLSGDCTGHVVRGGSWGSEVKDSRVANRIRYPATQVDDSIGIRVVKSIQR